MNRTLAPLLLVVFSLLASVAGAQSAIQDTPTVPDSLRTALLAGDTANALEQVDALQTAGGEDAHFWAYLRGVVLEQQGSDQAAADAFQAFSRDYPDSPWRRKAAFHQADALSRLGNWQAAEALIEAEVTALRGGERQAALAAVYLERADELSAAREGAASLEPRDLDLALALYRQALALDLPAELRADTMGRVAWCEKEAEHWQAAAAAYEDYLQRRPADEQAQLDLGECLLRLQRYPEARQGLEDLAASTADQAVQALAMFMIGRAYGDSQDERRMAVGAFRRYLAAHPRHAKSSAARFNIGLLLDRAGDLADSAEAYQAFQIAPEPDTQDLEALKQDVELRRRSLMELASVQARLGDHHAAARTYGRYVTLYPDGPEWAQAQAGMVSEEYAVATTAMHDKQWAAASASFTNFAAGHPLDSRSREAAFLLGDIDRREAGTLNKTDPRRASLMASAVQQWQRLADKFPGTDIASRALYNSGMVQEFELQDVEAAVTLYRRCDFGDFAGQARMRLAEMTEPSLAIETPRSWRTDEAASFTVDARNLEELKVQVYALDLETYFRKELRIDGVADLDLDLIAADQEYTYRFADYQRYKPMHADIALPVDGPGVWAVAVSTDDQRATTLVVRSDLDIIVKASAIDLLVFAEDLRTLQPVPGAIVIAAFPHGGADGMPKLVEFTCDEQGIGHLDLRAAELENAGDPSLLVKEARGLAATSVGTSWLSAPSSLQDLAVVDSDRAVYAPGATVSWRAILRESQADRWQFTAGKEFQVDWREPGGRLLWQETMALDDFGTLHGARKLDPSSPLGRYRIVVRDHEREIAQRQFDVQRIELQQVELTLDSERAVYYRGEEIHLAFQAQRFYGAPIADAALDLSTPDGRVHHLRTDQDGRVTLDFDTRSLARSGRLDFRATLPREGLSARYYVLLSATGFRASLSLDQETPLAGRSAQIELHTTLADGTPAARAMDWEGQRQDDSGNFVPVPGMGGSVSTDEDGKSVWAWTAERGGLYRLRAHGVDRFGNPIATATDVYVSGGDDPQKLRLLSSQKRLDSGGQMELEIINRAAPGLALITIEGGRILEHHLREIPSGPSKLALPVDGSWFPNMAVSIAMMDGNELLQASREFRVDRGLSISMTAAQDVVLPGEEAQITIEVRDQLGQPVAASLSLAGVDASLLAQYPTGLLDLDSLPAGLAWRDAEMQISSSCWFSYQGVTVALADELLVEQQLLESSRKWAEGSDRARQELMARAATRSAPSSPGTQTVAGERMRFKTDTADNFANTIEEEELSELGYADDIGIGGGAGGRFGGRGGRATRKQAMTQEETLGPDSSLAYWSADIRTDAQGQAVVNFTMPQRSTRWQLDCRGVSQDGALGQASLELISRADFFVDLRTPARLLDGDRPGFLATVHNLSGHAGEVELQLTVDAGTRQQVKRVVEVPANGEVQVMLHLSEPLQAILSDQARVDLLATASLNSNLDAVPPIEMEAAFHRELPMQPWGLPRGAQQSGILGDTGALVSLQLPSGNYSPDTALTIDLGSSVDAALLTEATSGAFAGLGRLSTLGGGMRPQDDSVVGLASELQGRLAVAQHVADSATGGVRFGDPEHLRSLASRDLSVLLSRQRGDGGWAWSGISRASMAESSAVATAALEAARLAGLDVPTQALVKARGFLQQALGGLSRDAETTALVLDVLSLSGNADFGIANRLHRDRGELSPAALAHLARALQRLKSGPMAKEILHAMLARRQDQAPAPWSAKGGAAWFRSDVAMDALALLAVVEVQPQDPARQRLSEALWSRRPWPQGGPHGLALTALAAARQGEADAQDVRVAVTIGDGETQEYELRARTHLQLSLPLRGVTSSEVRLAVLGRGAPAYRVSLEGFDTDPQPQDNGGLSFTRVEMLAPNPSYDGMTIRPGFGVTDGLKGWRNTVATLDYGAVSMLEIDYRTDRYQGREVNHDFLILEVPLPAGAKVVEDQLTGDFLDWQQLDGVAVFTLGRPERSGRLQIPLRGLVPGDYRMLPPVLADAYDPSHAAIASPASLTVLDPDVARKDVYRATPDELYAIGIAAFDAGDRETSWTALRALEDLTAGTLRAEPLKESTRRLLTMALARADANAAVRSFEVLKERFPDVIIGFEEIAAVAASYRELAEFERASRIYLAIAGETFGKDLKVAGVLEDMDDFHASGELMLRLWQEYPDFPSVVETGLTIADRLLQKAPSADRDPSLHAASRDRAVLLFEAVEHLRHFLALYPRDPLAGDAALDLVSAYLDLEDYDTAATVAAEMASRFTQPRLTDAFTYTEAVAEWYRGQDAEAEALLTRIAEAEYSQKDGSMRPSDNRDLALYILAQIHHARRDFPGAAAYYERVQQVFSDAAQVLAGFRRRALAIDEITEVRPGETAMVPLHFRNLDQVELLVYPVDLMTLYLRERSLSGITQVNLAGIHPLVERTVALEDDGSMRTQDTELALELPESGAYLIICRADSLHASGMLLVSDMELEVAAASANGQVRVQAIDREDGHYLADVDVRVIGDAGGGLLRGKTDRRGLYSVDGVPGSPTVIARHGARDYAFFRGAPSVPLPIAGGVFGLEPQEDAKMLDQNAYFSNVRSLNGLQQERRANKLQEQQEGVYLGVSVDKVK